MVSRFFYSRRGGALMEHSTFLPKPKWGQNFLIDRTVLAEILDAAELVPEEAVLEIGPGKGILTEALILNSSRVFAIEIDERLSRWLSPLRERYPGRLSLFWGDACTWDYSTIFRQSPSSLTKIVANIPYSITTPLLWALITSGLGSVSRVILLLEKVAMDRLTAPPGTKSRGPLGIVLETLGGGSVVRHVAGHSFRPVPRTDSVLAVFRTTENLAVATHRDYRKFLENAFRHRRKTLSRNLRDAGFSQIVVHEAFARIGINKDGMLRAEELSSDTWLCLYKHLSAIER
jgi:16S rRNA (adenine1518-N6/adenine1519-N6)-dimethyltransferase